MSANLRDWYLDTLGVVQYRPRQEGAVDIPFHMDIEPQLESRTQLGSKPQAKTVDAEDIPPIWDAFPETSPDKVVSKESPQKGEASPIQSDSALPVDPFRIACWQQGDDLHHLLVTEDCTGGSCASITLQLEIVLFRKQPTLRLTVTVDGVFSEFLESQCALLPTLWLVNPLSEWLPVDLPRLLVKPLFGQNSLC